MNIFDFKPLIPESTFQRFYLPGSPLVNQLVLADREVTLSVPAVIEASSLFFSIETKLASEIKKPFSTASITHMINHLLSLVPPNVDGVDQEGRKLPKSQMHPSFDETSLGKALNTPELKSLPNDVKLYIVDIVRRHLDKSFGAGLTLEMIKTSIDMYSSSQTLTSGQRGFSQLLGTLELTKDYYAAFCNGSTPESIASDIVSNLSKNPIIAYFNHIYTLLYVNPANVSVPHRLSEIVNTFYSSVVGHPLYEHETLLTGRLYDISDVKLAGDVNKLTFKQVMYGVVYSMRALMGQSHSGEVATIGLADLIDHQVFRSTDVLMGLPSQLKTSIAEQEMVHDIFADLWFYFSLRRCLTGDFGSLASRISGLMDMRFSKDRTYDSLIMNNNKVLSCLYDGYLDTSAFFKHLATSGIYAYPDMNYKQVRKYSDLVFEYLGTYSDFTLGSDNPRFLSEPAHVLNHSLAINHPPVTAVVPDSVAEHSRNLFENPVTGEVSAYARSVHVSGTVFDIADHIRPGLWSKTIEFEPVYYCDVPNTPFLADKELFQRFSSLIPVSRLLELPYGRQIISQGVLRIFTSSSEVARFFTIPLKVAEGIFEHYSVAPGQPTPFVDLSDSTSLRLFLPRDLVKIVYVLDKDSRFTNTTPFAIEAPGILVAQVVAPVYKRSDPDFVKRSIPGLFADKKVEKLAFGTASKDPQTRSALAQQLGVSLGELDEFLLAAETIKKTKAKFKDSNNPSDVSDPLEKDDEEPTDPGSGDDVDKPVKDHGPQRGGASRKNNRGKGGQNRK